ncbi:reductive dehalogenase [bacterium]|nr:reductive dehalogenase [bacterium]
MKPFLFYTLLIGSIPLFACFFIFAITSYREKEYRASYFSLFFALYFPVMLIVYPFIYFGVFSFFITIFQTASLIFLCIIFFYKFPQTRGLRIKEAELARFDERDTIFSRMRFIEGSKEYDDYYKRRAELKAVDDKLRGMPTLSHPETDAYDPMVSPMMFAEFSIIETLFPEILKADCKKERQNHDPFEMAKWLKQTVMDSGAVCCGITHVSEDFLYSHKGYSRKSSIFGSPVLSEYKYALVFAVEMDYFKLQLSPKAPTLVETARQYVNAARIAIAIANYIKLMGYKAKVESVANYYSILPALAYQAGLGELGRIGILMTQKYGPRVRLGAVLTDMPLACDAPVNEGMQHFCELCTKCADCCPSRAIPDGDKTWVRGVHKWQMDPEKCYRYWRKVGTDCGICMRVCPYSKPDTFLHNIVRFSCQRSYLSRSLWPFADDLFYGKNPQKKIVKSLSDKRHKSV